MVQSHKKTHCGLQPDYNETTNKHAAESCALAAAGACNLAAVGTRAKEHELLGMACAM